MIRQVWKLYNTVEKYDNWKDKIKIKNISWKILLFLDRNVIMYI